MRFFSDIIEHKSCAYSFISFNYTNLFDIFLDKTSKKSFIYVPNSPKVLHIHGQLGEDLTLGVDNEKQLDKIPYSISARLKRNILKPFFLKSYDQTRMEEATRIIRDSDIICVFGLSLGDSDITWRNLLAKWLVEKDESQLLFYNYEYMQKEYHPTAIPKKLDDEESAKEKLYSLLFEYELNEYRKTSVMNRIHIPVGVKIFNFEQLIS